MDTGEEARVHKTKPGEWTVVCFMGIDFASIYTIHLYDIGTDLTVWYSLFFFLFYHQ